MTKVLKKRKTRESSETTPTQKGLNSTRDRMLQRKKELESKGNGGGMVFPKEGVTRIRLHSQGPDKEIGLEVIQFYVPKNSVISAATFDDPCPFMEKYQELKNSKDEDDQELAGRLVPRRRYIVGGTVFKDEKGKEIDPDNTRKPIMIPRSVYQDIIELYLEEDDWGDMTDPDDGYDIKITRTGTGKNDTKYSVTPCPKRSFPSNLQKPLDLEAMVRSKIGDYDATESILNSLLNKSPEEEEEDPRPSRKKKKTYRGDI